MITYIFDFVLLLTLHIMVYRCQDNDPCKMCEIELFSLLLVVVVVVVVVLVVNVF